MNGHYVEAFIRKYHLWGVFTSSKKLTLRLLYIIIILHLYVSLL